MDRLKLKLYRGDKTYSKQSKKLFEEMEANKDFPSSHYKKRHLSQITHEEIIRILYKVKIDMSSHDDVAKCYRIHRSAVTSLLAKFKKNPRFIIELQENDDVIAAYKS